MSKKVKLEVPEQSSESNDSSSNNDSYNSDSNLNDSSSNSDTNSNDSSSDSDSSSSILECSISSSIPSDDFCFLLTRSKFFSDPAALVFKDKVFVLSNDIVLYHVLLLDYPLILSLVDKKIKKHINALVGDKTDTVLVYSDKLCNISPMEVVKALKKLHLSDSKYIFISKCFHPSKEEREEFIEVFPEHKEDIIPVRVEEIFLNEVSKIKKNFQVSGAPYQMYLLSKGEFEEYIHILEKESQ